MDQADEPVAIVIYEEVLEIEPYNFEALWNLSLHYSKKGHRYEEAVEVLNRTVALESQEMDYPEMLQEAREMLKDLR